MRRLPILLSALLLLICVALGQNRPAQIRLGDELSLTLLGERDISGDYVVQNDGAVYIPKIGRVRLVGRTAAEGEGLLSSRFRTIYRDPAVYLTIKKQRASSVYVVGGEEGLVDLQPGTDLRQVFAQAKVKEDADLLRISVYRLGKRIASVSASDLLSGKEASWNGPVRENDVVIIEPKPYIRVTVGGDVRNPGRKRLDKGDDVYRAIAEAGDLAPADANSPAMRSEISIVVRRGLETIRVPLVARDDVRALVLEDGDTVMVEPPAYVRVTVAGEVARPGEVVIRQGQPLLSALASAGGPLSTGTARSIYLFRDGEARIVDATARGVEATSGAEVPLQAHDILYVPRNERAVYAFGEVQKPGRYLMEDSRTYRLSDVLAEAGGITAAGTTRRVYLLHPTDGGAMKPVVYQLDQYIRNGKLNDNPIVRPNDVVVFDQARPNGISVVTQAVSSFFLLNTLFRR